MAKFETEDRLELLALVRAIAEAKFHPDVRDKALQGSPVLAAVARRLLDAHIEAEVRDNPAIESEDEFEAWWLPENQPEWVDAVRERIHKTGTWPTFDDTMKRRWVADLLTPMFVDDAYVESLVEEGDRVHAARRATGN